MASRIESSNGGALASIQNAVCNHKGKLALVALAATAVALGVIFGPQIIHGVHHLSSKAITGLAIGGGAAAAIPAMALTYLFASRLASSLEKDSEPEEDSDISSHLIREGDPSSVPASPEANAASDSKEDDAVLPFSAIAPIQYITDSDEETTSPPRLNDHTYSQYHHGWYLQHDEDAPPIAFVRYVRPHRS